MKDVARRVFLRGLSGLTVGLPALDVFRAHEARAQARVTKKIYSTFLTSANGVQQAWNSEPERFWPRTLGPITDASMRGVDADRATSELRGHAGKLIMIKGLRLNFPGNGCGHTGAYNQILTAARVSSSPSGSRSLATGESVDNRIARELTPGREPLALYAGRKPGDHASYRGPLQLRAADNNPWTAYQRLLGLDPLAGDAAALQLMVKRRKSANDVLRGQMKALLARPDLSAHDRERLDLHFSSIRDMELNMTRQLGPMEVAAMQAMNGKHQENDRMEAVTQMQIDLMAFALASDLVRTGTLQVGSANNPTQYIVDGVKLPSFHYISHRIYSDGAQGTRIPDAALLHHKIDRIHMRHFKHLLDRLSAYTLPEGGTLLDSCIAVYCNSLANGPPHGYSGVPFIIGGSGGGFFKTGQFVEAKVTHNRLFNSILTATGVRRSDGEPVDNFGDPSLPRGFLGQIHA